jgi:hypothetical protein
MSNYFPYRSLIDAGSWSGSSYNYGYNGMLKEGIGKDIYHTLNRGLFTIVPVWMKTDPLEYMFPGQSPYVLMNNNPILMVDVNGDSAFVFDTEGKYIESIDDGKKDWSIQVTDGKNTQYYQINNPEEDVNTIKNTVSQEFYKNKKIIEIVDTEKEDELINSKTKDYENSLISKYFYVLFESLNFSNKEKIGKLDFSKEILKNNKGNQPLLYLNPEHRVVYNVLNMGTSFGVEVWGEWIFQ